METVVRLEGAVEDVLKRLVELGYFKTRAEVIRAGILELGKEYRVLKTPQEIEDALAAAKIERMAAEMRNGKAKWVSLDEVAKKAGVKLD